MAYANASPHMPQQAPAGRPKRPTWHWLVLGAVALLGLLVVAALALIIGWKILDRGNPEDTLDDFYTSLQSADCDLFMESTTDEFQQDTGLTSCAVFDENISGVSGVNYEVTDRTNRQGYAIFEVTETFTADGQSESVDTRYYVRRVNGQWDLDIIEAVQPGSDPIT